MEMGAWGGCGREIEKGEKRKGKGERGKESGGEGDE
jgi:hypothetical protein